MAECVPADVFDNPRVRRGRMTLRSALSGRYGFRPNFSGAANTQSSARLQVVRPRQSGLVEALIVAAHVDFTGVAPGDKNKVSRCQSEANGPPEGSDQQSGVAR